MKKRETRKDRDAKELAYLTNNQLTTTELSVIRKLNGGSSVPGNTIYSKRTIEAVLQGRRSNPRVLQLAIGSALERSIAIPPS